MERALRRRETTRGQALDRRRGTSGSVERDRDSVLIRMTLRDRHFVLFTI